MTIYRLFKQTYYGGIGDRIEETNIGYYLTLEGAGQVAKEINEKNLPIVYRRGAGDLIDLSGRKTTYPYDGYVIWPIEVIEK